MTTTRFWKASLERAAKSAAQGVVVFWAVGDGLLNLWTVDPMQTLGVGLGMGLLSLLTSVISAPVGDTTSPSLVRDERV